MIKNEKGVSLLVLVIMAVILGIILIITLDLGTDTLERVENEKITTELSNVQQALFQQYTLLRTYNADGKIPEVATDDIDMASDVNRPEQLIGTRVVKKSTLEDNEFSTFKKSYDDTTDYSYEEYYYIINKSDLEELGIVEENTKDQDFSYIVNYSTGEVFDLVNKIYVNSYTEENASLTGAGNKIEKQQYNFTE